jgi:peroxiredoxin
MSKRIALFSGLVAAGIILAACGTPSAANVPPTKTPEAMMEKTPDKMMEKTSDTMMKETPDAMMDATPEAMMNDTPHAVMDATPETMMDATPDAMMETTPDAMMDKASEAMMEMPGWFAANLTDAATGATFKMQDFKGKVVLVETMAMWCPTCLRQQKEVKALHDQLGKRDDFKSVGIDVDINENLTGLKDYTTKNGFDWTYTVANADVAREIGNLYGQQFLNPPSAPMFIIDRHGEVHPLPFGVKSAADLQKALEPFLNEAM